MPGRFQIETWGRRLCLTAFSHIAAPSPSDSNHLAAPAGFSHRESPHRSPLIVRPPDIALDQLDRPLHRPIRLKPSADLRIDLNSATVDDLSTLPGIDRATAHFIVRERPYGKAEDLIHRKILSAPLYHLVKDDMTVRLPSP